MEVLLIIPFLLGYLVTLYFINKNKATKVVLELMKYAKEYLDSGEIKKEFVKETTKEILSSTLSSLPLSSTVNKVVESKVEQIIESNVEKVKAEKIDLGAMDNANLLVEKVMQSEDRGIISVYGKVVGDDEKKINYEVGLNYIKKL